MGILDRLFGRRQEQPAALTDEQALQRYRYMLRTAPPEAIEQAHAEAFARLTPTQRAQVLRELSAVTPPSERAGLTSADDPKALARLATRAELRQPGSVERTLAGAGGPGFGSMMAGSLFASLVGGFVGSMVAQQFYAGLGDIDFGMAEPGLSPVDQHGPSDVGDFGDVGDFDL